MSASRISSKKSAPLSFSRSATAFATLLNLAELDAAPDDAFDRAEGLRYVSRLARNFLRNATETSQPPRLALGHAESPKIGLDNPDYVYCGASLDADAPHVPRGELAVVTEGGVEWLYPVNNRILVIK